MGARTLPSADGDQRGRRGRRDGARGHGVAAQPRRPGLHAGHRTAAGGDVRPLREGPRTLRDRRRVRVSRDGRRLGDGDRPRPEPDVRERRPPPAVLRDPQGGAAEAQARDARRVGRGPPPGAVAESQEHREGRAGSRSRRDREAQPGGRLDTRPGLGLHQEHDVPYHALFDQGYTSIGCAPCTRAVAPGESERRPMVVGTETDKECGIHCSVGLLGSASDRERAAGQGWRAGDEPAREGEPR